jgi:glycosyltransferase involved in cell wall biosynthesis
MNVGGPALQVTALARHLDALGFEQRLLVGSVGRDEADYLELRAPDVEVVRIPGLGRSPSPAGDAKALGAIVAEIRRFRPEIVHTHTAKAGVLGRAGAILGRAPHRVHTFHGHLLHGYFSPSRTRAVVAVERSFARATTRLVAVGARVRDELLAAGIGRPEQYTVVPPGLELPPAPTRGQARECLGLPADVPVVAFVARLTGVKRPDRFVALARLVVRSCPDAVFVVAGEGEGLAEMQREAADLGNRMRFLGWRSDVETIYAAADLTALTSDNEGMPVSLIEAAAVGCPAVTTDVGSAGEVVEHGVSGFVTPPDPVALADAAIRLISDPALCARFGAAAEARAQQRFTRQRLVADIAALYEDILSRRPLCTPS